MPTRAKSNLKIDKHNRFTTVSKIKSNPSSAGLSMPVDTGASDTHAINRAQKSQLGGAKTKYKKSKRTPYN